MGLLDYHAVTHWLYCAHRDSFGCCFYCHVNAHCTHLTGNPHYIWIIHCNPETERNNLLHLPVDRCSVFLLRETVRSEPQSNLILPNLM